MNEQIQRCKQIKLRYSEQTILHNWINFFLISIAYCYTILHTIGCSFSLFIIKDTGQDGLALYNDFFPVSSVASLQDPPGIAAFPLSRNITLQSCINLTTVVIQICFIFFFLPTHCKINIRHLHFTNCFLCLQVQHCKVVIWQKWLFKFTFC